MAFDKLVNPFIGVDSPGNCLCGPYLPNSIVRLSPDVYPPHSTNGYRSNKPIRCFSHTHVSGTGGGGRYGNIGVMPIRNFESRGEPQRATGETASLGYYSTVLEPSGIRVELTSTPRVGVHRYTFPPNHDCAVMLDVGAVIQTSRKTPGQHSPGPGHISQDATGASVGGYLEVLNEYEICGRGDYQGGWGHNFQYTVFFAAIADRPITKSFAANYQGQTDPCYATGPCSSVVLEFGSTEVVQLRVGVSFLSVAHARESVEREVAEAGFEEVVENARGTWDELLSKIRVEGGDNRDLSLFYTLFTRVYCMPTDLGTNDENPWWRSSVRSFTDFYALWDSVRNTNSLITLIDPDTERDYLNALIDIAEHTGWLPDAWVAGHPAMVQGGSSADILFCEAALKGVPGVNYDKALSYMRKNAETESPNPWYVGRFLSDYRDLGYVSTDVQRSSVSRHLEYAYQDWCIGELAQNLGYDDAARSLKRSSEKVWNLWDPEKKSFTPKRPDGRWIDAFDRDGYHHPHHSFDPYFYEATGRQWSFNVHHDFAGLIDRHGGDAAFVEHLDSFFEGGHYRSKEIMLHVPYLYIYAGRPDKAAERVRYCLETFFRPERDGLSDNEDMGCQSSFFILSSLGLYPVMGQDIYLVVPPRFPRITLELGSSEKILTITVTGATRNQTYITGLAIDGVPVDRAWVRHAEIADGGDIAITLSATASDWGTRDRPPSPLSGGVTRDTYERHIASTIRTD